VGRQGGARLELREDRAPLGAPGLVFPDPLLATPGRASIHGRSLSAKICDAAAGPLRERLHPAGEDRRTVARWPETVWTQPFGR